MGTVQDDTPECDACVDQQADSEDILLCPKCERQILPQLKQPGWARLIGFTNPEEEKEPDPTPEAAKAIRRNDRKYHKRSTLESGLTCYFCNGGCGQPVNALGLVCGPCGEERRTVAHSRKVSGVHYEGMNGKARPAA
jgi:hypothetical protein